MTSIWRVAATSCATLLAVFLDAPSVPAAMLVENAPLVFSGKLGADDDVAFHDFSFVSPLPLQVVFESFSYAGGRLRDGTAVRHGGFDPMVSLFGSDGRLLGLADDWLYREDPLTGNPYDARLVLTLTPGDYRLAVSQYDNMPLGEFLLQGFTREGEGNFTGGPCGALAFCDSGDNSRTDRYVVEVAALSTVPVPAGLGLLVGALGTLCALAATCRYRPQV